MFSSILSCCPDEIQFSCLDLVPTLILSAYHSAYHPAVQCSAGSGTVLGMSYRVPTPTGLPASQGDTYNHEPQEVRLGAEQTHTGKLLPLWAAALGEAVLKEE